MSGSDSPPQTTPSHATLGTASRHILTANDPLADFPGGGAGGFDPRESFYPTALLKAEDLRVSLPRPVRRSPRFLKPLVVVLLVIGAVLAYVFFLQPQAPATRQAESPDRPAGNPGASGVISAPVASPVSLTLPAAPAKAPASPPPASLAKAAPAPKAAAAPPRPAPVASAPAPTAAAVLAPGARPVTHTKAAADLGEATTGAASVSTVVPAPPATPDAPRRPNCSAELTALGLCSPTPQGQPGK